MNDNATGAALTLLVLKSPQPERLKSFYECLGLRFSVEQHGKGPLHFAAPVGGSLLEVYPLDAGKTDPDVSTRLGFSVSDPSAVLDALNAFGSSPKPASKGPWGWRSVVRDPDGRAIELYWHDSTQSEGKPQSNSCADHSHSLGLVSGDESRRFDV